MNENEKLYQCFKVDVKKCLMDDKLPSIFHELLLPSLPGFQKLANNFPQRMKKFLEISRSKKLLQENPSNNPNLVDTHFLNAFAKLCYLSGLGKIPQWNWNDKNQLGLFRHLLKTCDIFATSKAPRSFQYDSPFAYIKDQLRRYGEHDNEVIGINVCHYNDDFKRIKRQMKMVKLKDLYTHKMITDDYLSMYCHSVALQYQNKSNEDDNDIFPFKVIIRGLKKNDTFKYIPCGTLKKKLNRRVFKPHEDVFFFKNKLKKIHIQETNIREIATPFKGFPGLEEIILRDNEIEKICYDAFCHVKNLKKINLGKNILKSFSIKCIVKNHKQISTLKDLNLRENFITKIHHIELLNEHIFPDAICFELNENRLSKEDVIKINELELDIDCDDQINNENFVKVQNEKIIYQCSLQELEGKVKKYYANGIEKLRISNFRKSLEKDSSLYNLAHTLTGLDISGSNINVLKLRLNNFKNLMDIDLSYNNLKHISFKKMENLHNIDLSHNKFVSIDKMDLRDCVDLHTLNLSHNQLHSIDWGVLLPKEEVEEIEEEEENGNKKKKTAKERKKELEAKKNEQKGMFVLGVIDISFNDIFDIKKLPVLKNFTELIANNNLIVHLEEDTFEKVPNLRILHLHNNGLRFLMERLFYNLKNLQDLSLHNNLLEEISPVHLHTLKSLQFIDLSCNLFRFISPRIFDCFESLQQGNIQGNFLKLQTCENINENVGKEVNISYIPQRKSLKRKEEKMDHPNAMIFCESGTKFFHTTKSNEKEFQKFINHIKSKRRYKNNTMFMPYYFFPFATNEKKTLSIPPNPKNITDKIDKIWVHCKEYLHTEETYTKKKRNPNEIIEEFSERTKNCLRKYFSTMKFQFQYSKANLKNVRSTNKAENMMSIWCKLRTDYIMNLLILDLNVRFAKGTTKNFEDFLKEVMKNIGMDIVNKMKAKGKIKQKSYKSHFKFVGAPGTGKTTIARDFTKILFELGVIKRNYCLEVTRADLVAKFAGQTGKQVKRIVTMSFGGVLFIDEAYALIQGGEGDYGKEAVDTLITLMENNRDDLVVILAGYKKQMGEFMNTNIGLSSRVQKELYFKYFDEEELYAIAEMRAKDFNISFTKEQKRNLKNKFAEVREDPLFGNGRGVRNLVKDIANEITSKHYDKHEFTMEGFSSKHIDTVWKELKEKDNMDDELSNFLQNNQLLEYKELFVTQSIKSKMDMFSMKDHEFKKIGLSMGETKKVLFQIALEKIKDFLNIKSLLKINQYNHVRKERELFEDLKKVSTRNLFIKNDLREIFTKYLKVLNEDSIQLNENELKEEGMNPKKKIEKIYKVLLSLKYRTFLRLDMHMLKELGINNLHDRIQIMTFIDLLRKLDG